ncbi:MAG: pyridoxal 5'-phosphate synthase glutaminase subunit PdxT [Solirubrobacterales bacterium]
MAGKKRIGVLALQGAFLEHQQMLRRLKVDAVQVRTQEDAASVDGLIIPGGESTTIGKLLVDYDLADLIRSRAQEGMPVFGTCAGMIVLAHDTPGFNQYSLDLMDISVLRNAFGRQVDSFEAELDIEGLAGPFRGIFIRAPYVTRVGTDVKVLCSYEGHPVMVRQGSLLAASFHPELTKDVAIHAFFTDIVGS